MRARGGIFDDLGGGGETGVLFSLKSNGERGSGGGGGGEAMKKSIF